MKLLPTAAACLLACQGQASFVQAAAQVAPPPQVVLPPLAPRAPPLPRLLTPEAPPSEAVIERFLASLPEDARAAGWAKPDPEAVKRLVELNPGKEARIAAILSAFEKCSLPAAAAGMDRVHRLVVLSPILGAEKLEQLTAFFRGPGWALLGSVADQIKRGTTPAAADLAERERLMAVYPLADFAVSMQVASLNAAHQGAFAAAKKCEDERNAALAEAGIEHNLGSVLGR